jgi:transposase-like protein
MSNNKKQAYPAEFKESSIKLALESGNSIAQTARES